MYIPRDDEDNRKKLEVFRVYNSIYSRDDDEYYKNLYSVKPKLRTLKDCIDFYNNWFSVYREVLKNWDNIND